MEFDTRNQCCIDDEKLHHKKKKGPMTSISTETDESARLKVYSAAPKPPITVLVPY